MARSADWAWTGLLALALAGSVGVGREDRSDEPDRIAEAQKCARLIQQGQLALKDAITIAEQHLKSTAIDGEVEVRTAVEKPKTPERSEKPGRKPGEPQSAGAQPAGDRLMYEITCVSGEKVHRVRIDGLEKKITNVVEQKPPEPKE